MAKKLVCTQCHYVGEPKGAIGGNGCIEVILWLCFIIPGLIYSIWRSSSRHKVCPKCGNKSLIPIDSPKAKSIMSETMTKEEIEKIGTEQKDTDFKARYLKWLNWCKKHKLWTVVIIIIGIPFLIGIISAIFGTEDKATTQQVSTPVIKEIPALTLTEKLKKINSDPYWTSNTPSDYSDNTKIQVQSILFSTYASEVAEGEKSSSEEDKKLATEIKKKLIAKQVQEYPKLRKAYAEYADNLMWEHDIDVTYSGAGNTTLTLTGAVFASNKGISSVETNIEEMLKELRFKRVNYKWMKYDEDYQYFDLKTSKDDELKIVSL